MATTVIGMFETRSRAESVEDELLRLGFDRNDISVSQEYREAGRAEEPGFWDQVKEMLGMEEASYYEEGARRGSTVLTVTTSEERADAVVDVIERYGPIDIDVQSREWEREGWKAPARGESSSSEGETRVPLSEEELHIGKRRVQKGGVRIYTRVTETPVEQDVELTDETVDVERRSTDRPADEDAFRERTIEATESHEEPVVRKEARTKEELVVKKKADKHTETVRDTVRKTEADVDKMQGDQSRHGRSSGEDQSAYQFGLELARDERYRGRSWDSIQTEAKRDFESRNLGDWNRDEPTIHEAYERARAA